ncbi:MAG: thiamine phosphate synthase [Limnobacter sp.]|nr:thiamine phosphate synthase [Limnobacter sp.]
MKSLNVAGMQISGVYAITPTENEHWTWTMVMDSCHAVLDGGVRLVQMRQKNLDLDTYKQRALQLGTLCERYGASLILNDAPGLPELKDWTGVSGVHLGKDDLSVDVGRALWGERFLIGATCYNQLENAQQAVLNGADHIAFGAVFPSSTKPGAVGASLGLFGRAFNLGVPRVAIGGIKIENLPALHEAGVEAVAVVSSLFGLKPDAEQARKTAEKWVQAWQQASRT